MKKLVVLLGLGIIFGIVPTILGIVMSKSVLVTILVGLIVLRLIAKEICE